MPVDLLSFESRFANTFVSYVGYIGKMIWPQGLSLYYPYVSPLPFWQVAGSVLLLAAITSGVISLGRKRPYLPVGWFWFLGTLVPVIGLVQAGGQAMADRYTYIPLIGLFVMIAMGIPDLWSPTGMARGLLLPALSQGPPRRIVLAVSAGLVLMILLVITRMQVFYWHDSIRVFNHGLAVTKNNYFFHNTMGVTLGKQGKIEEATAHFRESLRMNPLYARPHYNLANAFLQQGKIQEAIFHFSEALRVQPDFAEVHNNLGNIFYSQGKTKEAVFHLTEALRIKPKFAEARFNLAIVLARQGSVSLAMKHHETLRTLNPPLASRLLKQWSQ